MARVTAARRAERDFWLACAERVYSRNWGRRYPFLCHLVEDAGGPNKAKRLAAIDLFRQGG